MNEPRDDSFTIIVAAKGDTGNSESASPDRTPGLSISHGDLTIVLDDDKLISLNQLWRDAGSPKNREPKEWAKLPSTKQFIENQSKNLNGGKSPVWKSKKGKHLGGTWAHWKIAAEYAGYLNPSFKSRVYDAVKAWAQEEADPALKAKRAAEGFVRQGHPDDWAKLRLMSILDRNAFTSELARHGVKDQGFREITDTANVIVFKASAKEIKGFLGLAPTARTRDHLSSLQLSVINTVEIASTEKLRGDGTIQGNSACKELHAKVASAFTKALSELNINIQIGG